MKIATCIHNISDFVELLLLAFDIMGTGCGGGTGAWLFTECFDFAFPYNSQFFFFNLLVDFLISTISLTFPLSRLANNVIKPHNIWCCWRDYSNFMLMKNVYDLIFSLILQTENLHEREIWSDEFWGLGLRQLLVKQSNVVRLTRFRFARDYCLRAYARFTILVTMHKMWQWIWDC